MSSVNWLTITGYTVQDQVIEMIEETPSFGVWDFLSNVGGVIGLYGGMSLLTILELYMRDYESCPNSGHPIL